MNKTSPVDQGTVPCYRPRTKLAAAGMKPAGGLAKAGKCFSFYRSEQAVLNKKTSADANFSEKTARPTE